MVNSYLQCHILLLLLSGNLGLHGTLLLIVNILTHFWCNNLSKLLYPLCYWTCTDIYMHAYKQTYTYTYVIQMHTYTHIQKYTYIQIQNFGNIYNL